MSRRGELAGYAGTLILEEVDEDEHVARYRFQGARDGATATAAITVTAAGEIAAEVHPGHGSDLAAGALIAAVAEVVANGSIEGKTGETVAADEARPEPSTAPAAPPGRAARGHRALVAAGVVAALAAWALKGRR